jgi:hypothetical protein
MATFGVDCCHSIDPIATAGFGPVADCLLLTVLGARADIEKFPFGTCILNHQFSR